MKEILTQYENKKELIKNRLKEFSDKKEEEYYNEFMFCLLTPQSNAKKCWDAIIEINKLNKFDEKKVNEILKTRTRFHNNKTKYIMNSNSVWLEIKEKLNQKNIIELRNTVAESVKGYGLKEAGHFLRNIGKSKNKIAILDRHILRNLKELKVINEDKIKNQKHYFEIEQKFLNFSDKIGIPIDELDLLFWSKENGELFK